MLRPSQNDTYAQLEKSLTLSEQYELEWIELCTDLSQSGDDLKSLRKLGLRRGYQTSRFRSICWCLLLEVLTDDPTNWLSQRRALRNQYAEMKERYNRSPYKRTPIPIPDGSIVDDPLSQSVHSLWHQHFCDQELTKLINQDVARTFPKVPFFQKSSTQTTLASILFCYARANPTLCYRQGMHEILGPVLFVVHSDQQNLLEIQRKNKEINHTLYEVLDPDYLEADAYSLFTKLMDRMETYYRVRDVIPSQTGEFPAVNNRNDKVGDDLEVHINWMRSHVLAKADPQLDRHLMQHQIPLSIIGIRWYRVLFGREFSFPKLLLLWDAIFADNFDLIKYIPAAILISVRQTILNGDFVGIYQCLMNYQDMVDVRKIVEYSLHLRDSKTYHEPNGFFVKVSAKNIRSPPAASTTNGTLSVKVHRKEAESNRPRANSLQRIMHMSAAAAAGNAQRNSNDMNVNHHEIGISDGFLEDDSTVLRLEIQHLANILALSRMKLNQYVTTLRHNLPANRNSKVDQCLDGLEELGSLMQIRRAQKQEAWKSAPIERALEADEKRQGSSGFVDYSSPPRIVRRVSGGGGVGGDSENKTVQICDSSSKVVVENETTSPVDISQLPTSYETPDREYKEGKQGKGTVKQRKDVELQEMNFYDVYPEDNNHLLPCVNPQRERMD